MSTATPTLTCFFFLFALFSASLVHVNGQNGIEFIKRTCSQTRDYNFCLTTLQADSRSYNADLTLLDAIVMDLGVKNATSTLSYISQLLKQKTDPHTKACLQDCQDMYSSAIDSLNTAIGNLKAKEYADVNINISAAMTDADTCETGFTDGNGTVSPLSKQNQNLTSLGSLGLAILKLITQ